jgi:hypothetical protein
MKGGCSILLKRKKATPSESCPGKETIKKFLFPDIIINPDLLFLGSANLSNRRLS